MNSAKRLHLTIRTAIDQAQGMVAILDGSDVDTGTAAEIGSALALGKFVARLEDLERSLQPLRSGSV